MTKVVLFHRLSHRYPAGIWKISPTMYPAAVYIPICCAVLFGNVKKYMLKIGMKFLLAVKSTRKYFRILLHNPLSFMQWLVNKSFYFTVTLFAKFLGLSMSFHKISAT